MTAGKAGGLFGEGCMAPKTACPIRERQTAARHDLFAGVARMAETLRLPPAVCRSFAFKLPCFGVGLVKFAPFSRKASAPGKQQGGWRPPPYPLSSCHRNPASSMRNHVTTETA